MQGQQNRRRVPNLPGWVYLDSPQSVEDAKRRHVGYLANLFSVDGIHIVHELPLGGGNCERLAYVVGNGPELRKYYTEDANALQQLGAQGIDWRMCPNCPRP